MSVQCSASNSWVSEIQNWIPLLHPKNHILIHMSKYFYLLDVDGMYKQNIYFMYSPLTKTQAVVHANV